MHIHYNNFNTNSSLIFVILYTWRWPINRIEEWCITNNKKGTTKLSCVDGIWPLLTTSSHNTTPNTEVMETACFSETLVSTDGSTRRHHPEEKRRDLPRRENIKSHTASHEILKMASGDEENYIRTFSYYPSRTGKVILWQIRNDTVNRTCSMHWGMTMHTFRWENLTGKENSGHLEEDRITWKWISQKCGVRT
jgi:hypothetical protein